MKKIISALGLTSAIVLSGCGIAKPEQTYTNDYNYVYSLDISSLDYLYTQKASNGDHYTNFVDGLVEHDSLGNVVGALAESWTSNDEKTVWTFKLRKGAKWVTNNGEEYGDDTNADDFVAGLQHAADFDSQTLWLVQDLIVGLKDYKEGKVQFDQVGVKALDDYTLEYTLASPAPYFDTIGTYSILNPVNREFLESKGEGCKLGTPNPETCTFGATTPDSILYNGAYLLTNNTAKTVIEYTKNETYWDKEHVYIPNVKLVFDDGADPNSLFNGFDAGTYTAAPVRTSNPAVYKIAKEKYGENMYVTQTTSVTFYGTFNFDRNSYASHLDSSKAVSSKNEKQREDTRKAILNKDFRLAVFAAIDRGAYLAQRNGDELKYMNLRNLLSAPDFVKTSTGKMYGDLVSAELTAMDAVAYPVGTDVSDTKEIFLNPTRAKELMAKAKEALSKEGVEFPIQIDVLSNETNDINVRQNQSLKASIEAVLGADVQVNIILADIDNYYASTYESPAGNLSNYDLQTGSGWGPDYADPRSYLNIMLPDYGDMMTYAGLDRLGEEVGDDAAIKDAIGLADFHKLCEEADAETIDMDKRYALYAKAEAMLIANGLIYPMQSQGGTYAVTRIKPYSAIYSLYGNSKAKFKHMQVTDHIITIEEREQARAEWEKARAK